MARSGISSHGRTPAVNTKPVAGLERDADTDKQLSSGTEPVDLRTRNPEISAINKPNASIPSGVVRLLLDGG
jgi:hypothetical protein